MLAASLPLLLLLLLAPPVAPSPAAETHAEELLVRALPDGLVSSLFRFETTRPLPGRPHYELFAKPLGQILDTYEVRSLALSFTHGRWMAERWGAPILDAPVGAVLWVELNQGVVDEARADELFQGLRHALSGLFCSSLNYLDASRVVRPRPTFARPGAGGITRYGALSGEAVCSENLTPWLKLLPCRGRAGLAQLLNPQRVFDDAYHSMAIHVDTVCDDAGSCKWVSVQSLYVVLHESFAARTLTVPIDAPLDPSWSFQGLFNRTVTDRCPLAARSRIFVQRHDQDQDQLAPAPEAWKTSPDGAAVAEYATADLDLPINLAVESARTPPALARADPQPSVTAHRFLSGSGDERGSLTVSIRNTDSAPIAVDYIDVLPWFMRVYFHSLTVAIDGRPVALDDAFSALHVSPSQHRGVPSTLEFAAEIPGNASMYINVRFEKAFMHFTEHPPDAHRGFDFPAAQLSFRSPRPVLHGVDWPQQLDAARAPPVVTVHTEPFLMAVATPDFSMPYNVITLTSTVIALCFGSLFNLMMRRVGEEAEEERRKKEEAAGASSKGRRRCVVQ